MLTAEEKAILDHFFIFNKKFRISSNNCSKHIYAYAFCKAQKQYAAQYKCGA